MFVAVFAIAAIILLELILDGGMALNARQRAADIAGQAARAVADDLNISSVRSGHPLIADGACGAVVHNLVRTYADATKVGGSLDRVMSAVVTVCSGPGQEVARVEVTITTKPMLPGAFGGFTMRAWGTATVECGITQGVRC